MDRISSANQLQNKFIEERVTLYQNDLTKSFETANRHALWRILGKIKSPRTFVNLIKQDTDIKARLIYNSSLSDEITADNGQWGTVR